MSKGTAKKMSRILILSLIFILIFLFFNNCGIEDTVVYYQEPRNLSVEQGDRKNNVVYFYGYNQEKDRN